MLSFQEARLGRRKTVNMSEDIAQELNRLANAQGKTLYSLVNEIGIQAIEAHRQGFSLEQAVAAKKVVESAKKSRKVLVNQDMWYFASAQAMKGAKSRWLKLVQESAQWDANVYLAKGSAQDVDAEFVRSVKALLADYFWDCSDVSIEEKKGEPGSLSLRAAFVPEMPLEHTQALFKAFEGMFNSRGYVATDTTVEPGFLIVSFKKVGGDFEGKR